MDTPRSVNLTSQWAGPVHRGSGHAAVDACSGGADDSRDWQPVTRIFDSTPEPGPGERGTGLLGTCRPGVLAPRGAGNTVAVTSS